MSENAVTDPVAATVGVLEAWKDLSGWADGGWNLPPEGTEALERIMKRAISTINSLTAQLAEAEARGMRRAAEECRKYANQLRASGDKFQAGYVELSAIGADNAAKIIEALAERTKP